MANLRGREEREGDCRAMYSAVEVGARRLGELFGRYGAPTVLGCFDRYRAESDAAMRRAIRGIPDGVYAGEDWVDDDGHEDRPVPVRVTVTVRGERAAFDFTGTGAAVTGPMNATRFVAASAVYYSLKALVAPDVPANDGCYRPITVHVPDGTILNPPPEAPGRRRQSRDVAARRGRVLQGAGPGDPRAHHRRRPHHLGAPPLRHAARTGGGASSTRSTEAGKARASGAGRRARRAGPHVERHEHADRGHRDRVPDRDPPPGPPAGERRRGRASRRVRLHAGVPGSGRHDAHDDARATRRPAVGRVRRRARGPLPVTLERDGTARDVKGKETVRPPGRATSS